MPHLRHLNVDDFCRQLDHFAACARLIGRDEFLEALETGRDIEDGIVLTFDDGTADHYEHVVPVLRARGLWGLFFVPAGPNLDGRLLDMHRVHCLLAIHGGETMIAALSGVLRPDMIDEGRRVRYANIYDHQTGPGAEKEVKRTLNYYLGAADRAVVLDALCDRYLDEPALVRRFYMSPDQIRATQDAGMTIGAHGVHHNLLAAMSPEEQAQEISESFAFLEQATGTLTTRCFAYPYGGPGSYDETTMSHVAAEGARFAFTAESRAIGTDDLSHPLSLPRLNCMAFPYGKARA